MRKTAKLVLIAAFAAICVLPGFVHAQFTTSTNAGAVTITGYTGGGGTVIIPATTNGLPITGIADNALQSVSMSNLIIGSNVTWIGNSAFSFCSSLVNLTIPNSVTNIESYAFSYCSSMTNATLGSNVTMIGRYAFIGCSALTGIVIPASVSKIGLEALSQCTSLTAITVNPSNLWYSSTNGVLFDAAQDTLIQYPGKGPATYTIPAGVTNIGDYSFYGCANITNVTIPNSLASIGAYAFAYSTLTNLTMGAGVTRIGSWAFYYCSKLPGMTMGSHVAAIGDHAFNDCTSLSSVLISASVTNIGAVVFMGCSALSAIAVDSSNAVYSSASGVLCDKAQQTLIECPQGMSGSYTIPSTVTTINVQAFDGCSMLVAVNIPGSVTRIDNDAFESCSQLTSVTIPGSVTSVGIYMFENCYALTNAVLNPGVTWIGNYMFDGCMMLSSVSIPASVTAIGKSAFNNCFSLPSVTIPAHVTSIGDYAFTGCSSLNTLCIPNSVTSIGMGAFEYCSQITTVMVGSNLNYLSSGAFENCISLVDISFSGNAPTLADSSVFSGDTAATVYYLSGTTGWSGTFGGLPTEAFTLGAPSAYSTTNSAFACTPCPITLSVFSTTTPFDQLQCSVVQAPTHGTLTWQYPALAPTDDTCYVCYTPGVGFSGTDMFTFVASDGTNTSNIATDTVIVTVCAASPIIHNTQTAVSCLENSANNAMISFMGYTYTNVGQPLTFTLVSAPTNGTLYSSSGIALQTGATTADNNWTYVPAMNYTGPDSYVWNVADGSLLPSVNATVIIAVLPQPAARTQPVFKAGVQLMDGNQPLQIFRRVDPNGAQDKFDNTSGYDYAMPTMFGLNVASNCLSMAAPEAVDWNHDGLMDLLIGQADGRVALLINQGTKGNPVFNGYNSPPSSPGAFSYLAGENGQQIVSYKHFCSCQGGVPPCAAPRMVDWNNNGTNDLMLGHWSGWTPGVWVLSNFGTNNTHVYREKLLCNFTGLTGTYYFDMPFVTDWNGDGISDLIQGDEVCYWYPEGGTAFADSSPNGNMDVILGTDNNHGITANNINTNISAVNPNGQGSFNRLSYTPSNSFLNVPNNPIITIPNVCPAACRKSVVMADLTGTGGMKDLVIGLPDGTVWYAQNTGSKNFPQFTTGYTNLMAGGAPIVVGDPSKVGQNNPPPVSTCPQGGGGPYCKRSNYVNEARVAVADLDGDGLPDIIVGDASGHVTVYYQYNPNPFAIDQRVLVYPNHPQPITLTAKVDSGKPVTYSLVSPTAYGSLSGSGSNLVYTPNPGYTGPDSFMFTLTDGSVNANTGTVYIAVTNHSPVAQNQVGASTLTVSMNTSVAVTLQASMTGNGSLSYITTSPAHGTLSGVAPNLVYTPNAGYTGPDSFTFQANDGYTNSVAATVAFDVISLAVNFGPSSAPVSGYQNDNGSLFSAGRGYGWNVNLTASATYWNEMADPRLDRSVSAGSASPATWTCNLSNGNYFVTIAYGTSFGIGYTVPVVLQGQTNRTVYVPGGTWETCPIFSTAIAGNVPVCVTNGQLTLQIPRSVPINYIEVRPAYKSWGNGTFVKQDATTLGNWKGRYGADGYWLPAQGVIPTLTNPGWGVNEGNVAGNSDIRSLPSYVAVNPNRDLQFVEACYDNYSLGWSNTTVPLADSTTDRRALQHPWDTNGIASYWNIGSAGGHFTFDLNFTDGLIHQISLYCMGWWANSQTNTIAVRDAGDRTVLNQQVVATGTNGTYLTWNVSGHVHVQVTPSQSTTPAVSGVLFDTPVLIGSQPSNVTVVVDQPASFSVTTAQGDAPIFYQWLQNGVPIPGATASTYAISATAITNNGLVFNVIVSNSVNAVTSSSALLTVVPAIAVGATPTNGVMPLAVQFTASGISTNDGAMTYSWTFGDGGSSISQNPLYVYTNAGVFNVTLTAYAGNSSTISTNLTVVVLSNTYSLTTGTGGAGTGTVALNPPGGVYLTGTVVSVTAVPGSNSVFTGWSGALSGSNNPATVIIGLANQAVTGNFAFAGYTLTASCGTNGTISPIGIINLFAGQSQIFTMTPAIWYGVSGVTVDGVPVGAVSSYTFNNIMANHAISASFTALLAPHGTPYWWLAQHGWTNNFAAAELALDPDGIPVWKDYLTGTNPTTPDSGPAYNIVPYAEGFENLAGWGGAYTNISGAMGWSSATGTLFDQSRIVNLLYTYSATNLPLLSLTHTNALALNTQWATLTNSFGSGFDMSSSLLYLDAMMQFMPFVQTPANFTVLDTGIKGGVCVNANNQLAIYHGVADSNGTLLSNIVDATTLTVIPKSWHRVTLAIDATCTNNANSLAMFQVLLDGGLVTNANAYAAGWNVSFSSSGALPSTSSTGTWFRLATTNAVAKKLTALTFTGTGYVDDLVATTVNPFATTCLIIVTSTGAGSSSLGLDSYVAVPISVGANTQIVYSAAEWNRIASLTDNGISLPTALGARFFTQTLAHVSANVSNAVAFALATPIQTGFTNVPTAWLTNWTEEAVAASLGADGIGIYNKYLLGLDPTSSNSVRLVIDGISTVGSNVVIVVRRDVIGLLAPNGMNGSLFLQETRTMTSGFTNLSATAITGPAVFDGTGHRAYTNAVDGTTKFYKVIVQ